MQQTPAELELFPSGAEPGQPVADELDETAVSEQEQAQYTQIVSQVANTIYKQPEAILAAINNKGAPIHQQVGRLVAQLGMAIQQKAETAGDKLSPDVMFHAGDEIVGMVLDLAIQGGIVKLDPESEEYQKVHGMAMMEAEKAFGERILADPKKAPLAIDEAGNMWAQQVAGEVEAGTAAPEYVNSAKQITQQRSGQSQVGQGVSQALRNGSG